MPDISVLSLAAVLTCYCAPLKRKPSPRQQKEKGLFRAPVSRTCCILELFFVEIKIDFVLNFQQLRIIG